MPSCCASGVPPARHSFPTRRSSDLVSPEDAGQRVLDAAQELRRVGLRGRVRRGGRLDAVTSEVPLRSRHVEIDRERSEEHTSELQSRENLVCRLLLETKKENNKTPR